MTKPCRRGCCQKPSSHTRGHSSLPRSWRQLIETSSCYSPSMNQNPHQASIGVNRVARTGLATSKTCYRCGSSGHLQASCKFPKDVVCHGCGKKGHIKRVWCSFVPASIGKPTNNSICLRSKPVCQI